MKKLKKWDGNSKRKIVKKSWVDDIVFAVDVINKGMGHSVNGIKFAQINIYKVEEKWKILYFFRHILKQ